MEKSTFFNGRLTDLLAMNFMATLQFASLYYKQEVLVWSDCLLNLFTNFLIGNMVFVCDA